MEGWKTLSVNTVIDYGKFLKVENHKIELPDGRILEDWPWIITPDFVNVVVLTKEKKFLCLRQIKYAVEGASLAPAGGYIDPGEKPIDAAKRELLEETGYISDEWIDLGNFIIDANRGVAKAYIFLAKNAVKISESNLDDLEDHEVVILEIEEIKRALSNREFKVISWATSFLLALKYLGE